MDGGVSRGFALCPLGEITGAVLDIGEVCPGVRLTGAPLLRWLGLVCAWGPALAEETGCLEHPVPAPAWTVTVGVGRSPVALTSTSDPRETSSRYPTGVDVLGSINGFSFTYSLVNPLNCSFFSVRWAVIPSTIAVCGVKGGGLLLLPCISFSCRSD